MKMFFKSLRQYADFRGRATRKEYWLFVLFYAIFAAVACVIDYLIDYPIFVMVYTIAMICPSLAVMARRLHDVGKSGWMMLVSIIPVIGGIWLLVLLLSASKPEANKWGVCQNC